MVKRVVRQTLLKPQMKKNRRAFLAIISIVCLCFIQAKAQTPLVWTDFVESNKNGTKSILPDYSYSGYKFSEEKIPDTYEYRYFNVLDYGATINDEEYDDAAIQATIDAASNFGSPAVVFFPAGKYRVSSDHDLNKSIHIQSSNVVLKGEGSGTNGTEIYMDKMRVNNGHWQFRFHPKTYNTSTLTTIDNEATRGDFEITVASASRLSVGQSIIIHHQSEEFSKAHYGSLELNETAWTRLFGSDGGMTLYECHVIKKIKGNVVTFQNPIQTDLPSLTEKFTIRNLHTIEGVGIEDIRFTSGWKSFPREFVHHEDDTVDYGWNAVQFKFVQNAWIKNCEFKDWTQVADFRESIGITVDNALISGKRGHSSWITRRNYGVLIKDCDDNANHHHGPGVGYSGVSTVYLRYKMNENQAIDCHSGSPITTLLDDVDGGDFHTNGGPWESYPHHGRYLTFWNFKHKKSSSVSYNFWSVGIRKPATYAEPFFIGFQPTRTVDMIGAGMDEMRGVEVQPKSLFEAQLALRLNAKDTSSASVSQRHYHGPTIRISPNPFRSDFQIKVYNLANIESVEMFGLDGKHVAVDTDRANSVMTVSPHNTVPQGLYFLKIRAGNVTRYLKVLKE